MPRTARLHRLRGDGDDIAAIAERAQVSVDWLLGLSQEGQLGADILSQTLELEIEPGSGDNSVSAGEIAKGWCPLWDGASTAGWEGVQSSGLSPASGSVMVTSVRFAVPVFVAVKA